MAASVELRMSRTQDAIRRYQTFSMKVEVINAVEVSDKLFVFHRGIVTGEAGSQTVDVFDRIADPLDLDRIPGVAPTEEVPYYRRAEVILSFKTIVELEAAWAFIQDDVADLILSINSQLVEPVTVTVAIP